MQLIGYRGRAAALAGPDRAYLAAHIDRLPDQHPDKQFVLRLCLYAHHVDTGALPGEPDRYVPTRAYRHVRDHTMPAETFRALRGLPDVQLAVWFHVPREQVAARRRDLGIGAFPARPPAAGPSGVSPTRPQPGRHHRLGGGFSSR